MDCILETRGLTKTFHGFKAVEDVNLRVRRGSVHGLIGPNGAGKSTVFSLISKFLQPTEGQILYEGTDITALDAARISRQGLVRSFQISAVFSHLSLRDNVRVALQRGNNDWFRFWRSGRSLDTLNDRAMALLAEVGLDGDADRHAAELSYGRKRALEIATTIALDPKIMLLDEPMAGMGREDVAAISDLIARVARNRTVLMVEHNLSVVASLCDRISVLARGRILAEGTYDEVSANREVRTAYIGAH